MTPDFNIADSSTWPVVMTVEHLAAIYQRPVGGILKACQLRRFVPAPFQSRPYRFRKSDVLRLLEPAKSASPLRRVS